MGVLPDDWTVPVPTDLTREWFTSASVAVQTCASCAAMQHPPEEICHRCGAMEFASTALAPNGTVHSYTIVHYAVHPALADAVPYAVVLVSLDDAPKIRVVGNLLDLGPEEVRIGLPVTAVWDRRDVDGETIHLLQWRSAESSAW